jgi:hypothetical protein
MDRLEESTAAAAAAAAAAAGIDFASLFDDLEDGDGGGEDFGVSADFDSFELQGWFSQMCI